MKPWLVVASREIVVRLTNKTFIVSTLVMLGLIGVMVGVQAALASRDQVTRVAVVEPAGRAIADGVGRVLHEQDDRQSVRVVAVTSQDAAADAVRAESADACLTRTATGWELVSRTTPDPRLVAATRQVVAADALAHNATAAGTSVAAMTRGSVLVPRALDQQTADRENVALGMSFAFALLFMLASMTFGMQIASSVVEEKASRVVEIVASAIALRQLLAGKVVGNTVMAVGQIVVLVSAALVALSFSPARTMLPTLTTSAGWYVLFFLAGFLALACLWALAGALASRQEDLQSTTSPMTGILMLSYLAGFSAKGAAMTALSFVPIVSTTLMPVRLFRGDAPWWQALLSLAITLAFAAAAVGFSERLYRRSLLQTGGRVTLKEAMRLQD